MFMVSSGESAKFEQCIYHTTNGRDPRKTVYFTNFDPKYVRELYCGNIKELFLNGVVERADLHNVKVSFDETSSKVFVTFEQKYRGDDMIDDWDSHQITFPGRVATEVYKAVKMRYLRLHTGIKIMSYVLMVSLPGIDIRNPCSFFHVHSDRIENAMIEAENRGLGIIADSLFIPKGRQVRDAKAECLPTLLDHLITGIVCHVSVILLIDFTFR